MAVMMVIMAFVFGFRHPRVLDDHEPLDRRRRLVSVLALLIFILCFTPVPIDTTPH
jgi:membrane-associated protease RseP (regulator of RpoE activity)